MIHKDVSFDNLSDTEDISYRINQILLKNKSGNCFLLMDTETLNLYHRLLHLIKDYDDGERDLKSWKLMSEKLDGNASDIDERFQSLYLIVEDLTSFLQNQKDIIVNIKESLDSKSYNTLDLMSLVKKVIESNKEFLIFIKSIDQSFPLISDKSHDQELLKNSIFLKNNIIMLVNDFESNFNIEKFEKDPQKYLDTFIGFCEKLITLGNKTIPDDLTAIRFYNASIITEHTYIRYGVMDIVKSI